MQTVRCAKLCIAVTYANQVNTLIPVCAPTGEHVTSVMCKPPQKETKKKQLKSDPLSSHHQS